MGSYTYIGGVITAVIALYILYSLLGFQHKIIEGLDVNPDLATQIKANTTKIMDSLLVDKYRSKYEDVIVNMHEWCDAEILKTIVSGDIDTASSMSDSNIQSIATISTLNTFKSTLNDSMKYIDGI
jgi:hypothetical protein